MASCTDTQGWGPLARSRYDFTPCFEEGILLSTIEVALLVAAAARIWTLSHSPCLERTKYSRRLLWAKEVSEQKKSHGGLC
jgi:ATP-binding cassette subfamily C (CFTR/MRP) protein 1